MVEPVLTSKSSGARYGMVLCSAAVSCNSRASCLVAMSLLARTRDPKSINTGVTPSSAIIMLPTHQPHCEGKDTWFDIAMSVWDDLSYFFLFCCCSFFIHQWLGLHIWSSCGDRTQS